MPQNLNDLSQNDLLSNIDSDIYNKRQSNCQYFDGLFFNKMFESMNNMSIFHSNIRSSSCSLSNLKCYLEKINLNFSTIGISENWGSLQIIDFQNTNSYSHECTHQW